MAEPITLAQAKAQCRVTDSSEDALITSYIVAARDWVEQYTGHILVQRALTKTFSEFWDYLELPYRPVVSITNIAYTDTAGAAQTLLPGVLVATSYPYRIRPVDAWPAIQTYSPVVVTYTAGYAAGTEPQALLQAILMLVSHYHTNRGAMLEAPIQEIPLAVTSLCDRYRVPVM
jgi:uncharacterized phiE125 gp8 family phage protein